MAITWRGPSSLICLASDTKPTNVPSGTRAYVEDDGFEEWIFDGLSWNPKLTIEDDRFYDNFEGGTFSFTEAGTSPNGKWKNKFLGTGDLSNGTSGVRAVGGVGNVMYIKTGQVNAAGHTTSTVNYTVDTFQDFEFTCRMRTIQQLRTGSAPNSWEAAWLVWRVGDPLGAQMGYYFVLKTNGCEFGKSDNMEGSISNYILATPVTPTLTLNQWYNVRVRAIGNRHKVWIDGTLVIDYEDISPKDAPLPSRNIQKSGRIVVYAEDAEVEFDTVRILPLYPKSLIDYEQSVFNTTPLPSSNRKTGAFYGSSVNTGDNLLSGRLATQLGASNAEVLDDLGMHWSYTTGTTSGNQAGLETNAVITRRTHSPIIRGRFKLPSTTASSRFFFGVSNSATVANSDNPLNTFHGFGVGWKSGGTQWGIWGNNAQATETFALEGLGFTANEWISIYLELQSGGKCTVRLNNRTPVVITATTAKPSVSTSLYLHCVLTTTTTQARTLTIDFFDIEISPGNNVP